MSKVSRSVAVALDLASDWSSDMTDPDEQFHPLEPGEKWFRP
jgi:hypothetical protein